VTFLVAVLVVIGDILIEILKGSPAVEGVPEIVELFNILLGALLVSKLGNWCVFGKTSFSLKDFAPEFVEVALLCCLLAWRLYFGSFIYRVKLAALDGVKKNFSSLLDALEELVVFGSTGRGLLVGMMFKDLLAVGSLDLILGRAVSVPRDSKNSVVILSL
jgi:hypothetical protein